MKILDVLEKEKIIPVIKVDRSKEIIHIMSSLIKGGIHAAEITFRTECASEAIKLCCDSFPEAIVGAGTVLTKSQCEKAIFSGAKFIVSPGLSEEVLEVCRLHNIPYIPGCVTPTEIMKAISLEIKIVKFFPANVYGGIKAIKALKPVFPQVKFLPTGGVDNSNLKEFVMENSIFAIGGSWVVKGNDEEITALSKEARTIVNECQK